MKKLFTVLLTITILLTTTIVTSSNLVSEVEAAKGQGVSTSKYGSQTKYEVCGDRLCSEIPGGRQAYEEQKSASSPTVTQKRMSGEICNCAGDCTCGADGVCTCTGEAGPCVCGLSIHVELICMVLMEHVAVDKCHMIDMTDMVWKQNQVQ